MKPNARGGGGKSELPHAVGETVLALWPGTTSLWFRGDVINNVGHYTIKFDDGSQHVLPADAVQAVESGKGGKSSTRRRSPARTVNKRSPQKLRKSRSRSSSPSRQRRSSRSPGRPKSSTSSIQKSGTVTKGTDERDGPPDSPVRSTKKMESGGSRRRRVELDGKAGDSEKVGARTDLPDSSEGRLREGLRRRVADGNEKIEHHHATRLAMAQTARIAAVITPGLVVGNAVDKGEGKPLSEVRQTSRHFGGPVGAFLLTFLIPAFVLGINLMCTKKRCTMHKVPTIPNRPCEYLDLVATGIFVGWVAFQALLQMLPIGRLIAGRTLVDGTRLTYRMNGILSFLVSMAGVGALFYRWGYLVDVVYAKMFQLLLSSLELSLLGSIFFYVKSLYAPPHGLSRHSGSRHFFYDFFMGRELNPRLGGFDFKMFLELRPGLFGWVVLNLVSVIKDYRNHGSVSNNLLLLVVLQTLYVADTIIFEDAVLSTMDITNEGLGFTLVFRGLCFVPFVFTIASRFLVENRVELDWIWLAGAGILWLVGYIIYRASNSQKDKFRHDPLGPTVCHLDTIPTGMANKLLVGGWWGYLRHPNYFGDLLMALSWSLLTGYSDLLPYTYLIYLFTFLIHRSVRDDMVCSLKYGAAWTEYQRRVPFRIFPKIF